MGIPKTILLPFVMAFVTFVVIVVFLLWYVQQSVQGSAEKFCNTFVAIQVPSATPPNILDYIAATPSTPYGFDLQAYQAALSEYNMAEKKRSDTIRDRLEKLSSDYHCKEKK